MGTTNGDFTEIARSWGWEIPEHGGVNEKMIYDSTKNGIPPTSQEHSTRLSMC